MGAAGLAAATIVSGLSFGPAAASAVATQPQSQLVSPTASEREVSDPFKRGWRSGSSYIAFTNFTGGAVWGNPRTYSTLAAAKAASPDFRYDAAAKMLYSPTGPLGFLGQNYQGSYWNALVTNGVGTASFPDGQLVLEYAGVKYKVAGTTVSPNGPTPQIVISPTGNLPVVSDAPNDSIREFTANVSSVNYVAKSAVISGTATPGATVTIGSQTVTVAATGTWSMTVTGLSNGANTLTAIQKINNVEHDRKDVTVNLVEGGTLVGVDQGPIELPRGVTTDVPMVVQNNEARENVDGTVTLTAP